MTAFPRSLSARRAWIEIRVVILITTALLASLSARRAWIEIVVEYSRLSLPVSLSARRAWIEIPVYTGCHRGSRVALRKESVD